MAWVLGLGGHAEETARERLFARVEELLAAVGIPRSLEQAGVAREAWGAALPDLCRAAFADPSGRTNPRMPLLSELRQLLEAGYGF
jgi:acetaldehyde dehydrogenase/alcohol dehydrogenase